MLAYLICLLSAAISPHAACIVKLSAEFVGDTFAVMQPLVLGSTFVPFLSCHGLPSGCDLLDHPVGCGGGFWG